jgi:hypothetical protein
MNRCWNRLYMNSSSNLVSNNYPYCATGSANAYEGFKSLKMYSKGTFNGIKEYSVVYLPEFEEEVSSLKVSFNYKYGGTTYNINKVKVAVGISDSVGDTATFTRLATLVPTVVGWNEMEVELSGYTGTGRRIAIMQASTGTTAITGYIDNLTVDTISSCNRPATVTADSVSAYGATLAWTDPSEAGTYMLRWSDGVDADSITLTGVTTYVLTDLVPSTTYTVDVRSICWGTPTNARSVSFTTLCAPMPLPWEMNFDNITIVIDSKPDFFHIIKIYIPAQSKEHGSIFWRVSGKFNFFHRNGILTRNRKSRINIITFRINKFKTVPDFIKQFRQI